MHRPHKHKYCPQGTVCDYLLLPATKELHAQECENNDEEEEEKNKRDDGLHGVHQRDDQVSQRRPIPSQSQNTMLVEKKEKKCLILIFCCSG